MMKAKNRRILFSLAMLIWSGVMLYFYASGRISKYLAEEFRTIALLGGLGLAVVGLFNLLTCGQPAESCHDHGCGDCEGDHEKGDIHPLLAFVLMVVPLGLCVAWTKDDFTGQALSRKGLYDAPSRISSTPFLESLSGPITPETMQKGHQMNPDGYYQFSLMELFFSAGDRELQSALEGMKIETEGRWALEKVRNENGNRARLYRLFMTCCIADSRAVPIVLEFEGAPPDLTEEDWVKVDGTIHFPVENGASQPVLQVDHAESAEPPYEETFMRN
ncbi:DUF1980 domain-containing protein [Luteolibacter pohnpeiensis]|uniref:DUF1980 domain-containing protein n=1 Tax=Luteolibacter pohnpeiensis TaxID=454153 RepID=A0A934VWH6_9BACT|nr:DUF1980 domain-containing protein [Luteolibacter pohnpeiensis]MBK1882514.1 DUF1980 domain-containing protein [Luteolibacter pohnpeiensis]